jgi:predicted RNase H-like HicB family nuclease
MNTQFNVNVERDAAGVYVASVPSLHGCHTQARSMDELTERIEEAIALCLEVQVKQATRLTSSGCGGSGWRRDAPASPHRDGTYRRARHTRVPSGPSEC